MGDRGNIVLDFGSQRFIYLYTHWQGSHLAEILRAALSRGRGRWGDAAYLARIVFSEMVRDELLEVVGYGLSPYLTDNEHDLLVVDLVGSRVLLCEGENLKAVRRTWTFDEFVAAASLRDAGRVAGYGKGKVIFSIPIGMTGIDDGRRKIPEHAIVLAY